MSVRMRQFVERQIVSAVLDAAVREGYELGLGDGGDEPQWFTTREALWAEIFATDAVYLLLRRNQQIRSVYFVFDNDGYDVICDYSSSLEPLLARANALSDYWEGCGEWVEPPSASD